MRVVYTNHCHKVQVFCVLHVSSICLCVQYIIFLHTHCSGLLVCVIHLVWSSFSIERLMDGVQRALWRPGHVATPPRLESHNSVRSIYLSVQQQPGKSLTHRPSGFLNTERENIIICGLCLFWKKNLPTSSLVKYRMF